MFKFFKKKQKFNVEQKDWSAKEFNNPFYKKKKKFGFLKGNKKKIFVIIILGIGFYFIHFLFFSDFLMINIVQINGDQNISKSKLNEFVKNHLTEKALFVFPRNNGIIFSEKKLSQLMIDEFVLDSAEVTIEEKNKIIINIKEKMPSYIWITNHQRFSVDTKGILLKLASEQEKQTLMSSYDINNETALKGETVLNPIIIPYLEDIKTRLDQIAEINFDSFRLSKNQQLCNINVMTQIGVELYFDCDNNIEKQIQSLQVLLREKLTPESLKNLSYIDLRLIDKVYYK